MNKETITKELNAIFQRVFSDEDISIFEEMTADDVDEWDSLNHINLIIEVERDFKVKFSNAEIARLENVGDLISLISRKVSV